MNPNTQPQVTTPAVNAPPSPASVSAMERFPFAGTVAVGVLLAYFIYVFYLQSQLIGGTAVDRDKWIQTLHLLSGIEAIVFAASGMLFGREVNRARAENAEMRATSAEADSKKAQKEKATAVNEKVVSDAKGAQLAQAIQLKKSMGVPTRAAMLSISPAAAHQSADADLQFLADLAKSLYPDCS